MSVRKKPMGADDLESRAEELTRRVSARAKPDQDDDEGDERAAPPEPHDVKRVVIDDDDDEDDEDDGGEPRSRTERRAARSRERGALRRENDDLRRRLEELERRPPQPVVVHAQPPTPQRAPEDEEFERERRAIEAESEQLERRSQQAGGRKDAAGNVVGATPEEVAELRTKWWELEQRRVDLLHKRSVQRTGGGGQQGPTTPQQVNQAILMGEYPDVLRVDASGQPTATMRWAHARHQQILAEGAPNTLDTARKALNEARARFGRAAPRPAPTTERRARFESISRGGGSRDSSDERPRSVTLTTKQQAMAEERFPHLKPEEAHKRWAKNVLLKKRDAART